MANNERLPVDELDEDNPLWLVNEQIKMIFEGIGADEDHNNVIAFFCNAGLPEGTAKRIHSTILQSNKGGE